MEKLLEFCNFHIENKSNECEDERGLWEWTRLFLQITIIFLTVGGNILVILSILVVKVLRHPRNYLVVSLAVADLLVGVIVLPFKINLTENCDTWKAGDAICNIWVSGDVLLCTASIFALTAISIDRYFAIGKPLFHKVYFTATTIYFLIGLTWIIGLLPILPNWLMPKHHHEVTVGNAKKYNVCSHYRGPEYQIFGVVLTFFLPLCILIFVGGTIVQILKKQEAKFKLRLISHLSGHITEPLVLKSTTACAVCRPVQEKKGCIMIGTVVLIFSLCWLPFFSWILVDSVYRLGNTTLNVAPWVIDTFVWLGYFNSCANPVIYTMFSKDFRYAFKELMCLRCSTVNSRTRSKIYMKQINNSTATLANITVMSTIVKPTSTASKVPV